MAAFNKMELGKKVSELQEQSPFFHQVDLGQGVVTPGHYDRHLDKVMKLIDRLQLKGRKCLDIGCMDGKMSFEMERLGGEVIAIDQYDRPHMHLCMEALGSKVKYIADVKFDNMHEKLSSSGHAPFDFILNSGVLYHAISPFRVLIDCRRMLKNNGFMILETGFVDKWDNALYFQCDEGGYSPGTFFFPSRGCLIHMLLFVSMVPLVIISEKDRTAILCQAVKPSEMPKINPYQDRHHFAWDKLQPGTAECLFPLSMPELENMPLSKEHPLIESEVPMPPQEEVILPKKTRQVKACSA